MKIFQQIIVKFLLFFYLTSSYLSATHVHHDALEQHNDCKVCIVVKNIDTADVPTFDVLFFNTLLNEKTVLLKKSLVPISLNKGFNATAPPLFV